MNSVRIAEIFSSLQGEGQWAGVASTFVRMSGCNLRCAWCDTPYASWNPEGEIRSLEDILNQVESLAQEHVVITGGEPMIFDITPGLTKALKKKGHVVTIETAGTRFAEVDADLMSISPKLSNSTPEGNEAMNHEKIRLELSPLVKLINQYSVQLKFVVTSETDFIEIESLLDRLPPIPKRQIMIMAEGTDIDTVRKRQTWIAPQVISRGWRMTPRLHIELYGNTRGT